METQHKTQPRKKYRRKVVFLQPCLHIKETREVAANSATGRLSNLQFKVDNRYHWLITSTPQNIDSYPHFMNICYIILKLEPIIILTTLNEK